MINLTLEEKKWHGCKYHTIKPFLDSWSITSNNNTWDEMLAWCTNTYGKSSDAWDNEAGRWYCNDSRFWFRNESDSVMFILRWA